MGISLKMTATVIGSSVLGAGAIQALHAQAKPPAYVVFEIEVKGKEGNTGFLKDAQKVIFEHGGKYVAGGYDKTMNLSGAPLPNRVGILQFANVDAVKGWWEGGARDIQQKIGSKYADFRIFAVEGVQQ